MHSGCWLWVLCSFIRGEVVCSPLLAGEYILPCKSSPPLCFTWDLAKRLYLFHGLIQNLLKVALLDPHHKGCGTANCAEKLLWNHRDVRMSPGKGVEKSCGGMNALGETTERASKCWLERRRIFQRLREYDAKIPLSRAAHRLILKYWDEMSCPLSFVSFFISIILTGQFWRL